VHLSDWPDLAAVRGDDALVMAMDRVREVMTAGRGALRPFSAPV